VSPSPIRLLLVEDSESDAMLLEHTLAEVSVESFQVAHVERMSEAVRRLASESFDAILLDLSLPDSRGVETVRQADAAAPHLPIVVLTGLDDEEMGMEAVRQGAQDYLVKGHGDGRLVARAIRYARERKQVEEELKSARAEALSDKNRLEAVMEALPVGMAILDAQGGNIRCNPMFEQVWGSPRPATDSISDYAQYKARWLDTGKPVQPEEWASARAIREGKSFVGQEMQIERFDGTRAFVINSASAVFDAHGKVVGSTVAIMDITARVEAEEALKRLNETLEQQVAERTAVATRRAAQLQVLAAELTQTEHRERRRLAQILHDHLQQILYAARLGLGALRHANPQEPPAETIDRIDSLLGECIAESRSLTIQLCPPVLHEAGLVAAIEWLGRHMEQTGGLMVDVEVDPQAEPESEEIRILLFEAARELLFNVVKHAETGRARVTMTPAQNGGVCLIVSDEGAGFPLTDPELETTATSGFGLFSIRERLELLGGRLHVSTSPGQGTQVSIVAPSRGKSAAPSAAKDRPRMNVPSAGARPHRDSPIHSE
jgi:signal transduction histidine kinase/DNA-binding NarL/FixJ family response regulator